MRFAKKCILAKLKSFDCIRLLKIIVSCSNVVQMAPARSKQYNSYYRSYKDFESANFTIISRVTNSASEPLY
jgi:hypothetical protein